MEALQKLKLQLFLFLFFGFGGMMFIVFYFMYGGVLIAFITALLSGLFFAGIMSFYATESHRNDLKRLGVGQFTEKTLSVVQSNMVETSKMPDRVYAELVEKLPDVRAQQRENDKMTFWLKGKIPTWDQKLEIKALKTKTGSYVYHVMSKPRLPFIMVDNGKNLQNVLLVSDILT